jgi:hypothetical protein
MIEREYEAHNDNFYETYLYAKGSLKLVGWEDPGHVVSFMRFSH